MGETTDIDPIQHLRADEKRVERRMKRWMPNVADICANCGTQLLGPYCHACGQPTKHFIRHIPSVMKDLLEGVFNVDSRILRTLGVLLFRPGRLTMEYIAGRRARYTAPLQLYLIISVMLFVALSWVTTMNRDLVVINNGPNSLTVGPVAKDRAQAPEPASPASVQPEKADRAAKPVAKNPDKPKGFSFNGKPWDPRTNPLNFSVLPERWNVYLNEHIGRQTKKLKLLKKDWHLLAAQAFKLLPYAMFFLLPLYALLLAIVYVFKRRYYTEHLIFAVHIHCFSFALQLVLLALFELRSLLDIVDNGALDFAFGALIFWQFFGHLWAQKRVYAQGWIMTTLKYTMVMFAYLTLAMLVLAVVLVASVLTF